MKATRQGESKRLRGILARGPSPFRENYQKRVSEEARVKLQAPEKEPAGAQSKKAL